MTDKKKQMVLTLQYLLPVQECSMKPRMNAPHLLTANSTTRAKPVSANFSRVIPTWRSSIYTFSAHMQELLCGIAWPGVRRACFGTSI